jgi:hypothetical protein
MATFVNGSSKKRCLLDISTAQYFFKVSKTILHKLTANSGINIFYNKCEYKYYLQLFRKTYSENNSLYKTRTFFEKLHFLQNLIVTVNDG